MPSTYTTKFLWVHYDHVRFTLGKLWTMVNMTLGPLGNLHWRNPKNMYENTWVETWDFDGDVIGNNGNMIPIWEKRQAVHCTMIPPIYVHGKAWAVDLTGHITTWIFFFKTLFHDRERALAKRTKLRTSSITGQNLKLPLTGSRISHVDACTSLITRQHLKLSITCFRISHLDACPFSQTCPYIMICT